MGFLSCLLFWTPKVLAGMDEGSLEASCLLRVSRTAVVQLLLLRFAGSLLWGSELGVHALAGDVCTSIGNM